MLHYRYFWSSKCILNHKAKSTYTMDDNQATANNMAEASTNNSSSNSSSNNGTKTKSNRHTFPKISKATMVHGEHTTTYPFLETPSESELAFCRLLAVEKPFIAPFGSVTTAWKDFIVRLNEQRDENNNLQFVPPMTERYARERVTEYFSFVKMKIDTTPLKSGCDDEDAPCELLQVIEDLYEQKISFESEATKKKNASALNAFETNAIRSAALNGYNAKPPPVVTGDDPELSDDPETPMPFAKKRNTGSSSSSDNKSIRSNFSSGIKSMQSTMEESTTSMEAVSKRRLDVAAEKELNKKLKYELKLKILEEKKAKRDERAKQKEFRREEERKDKELERKQTKLMLDTILALNQKNSI